MLNLKNKFLGVLLVMIISFGFVGQAYATVYPIYDYAKSVGGAGGDGGVGIQTDSSGNIYVMSIFEGTVDFDPSSSTANLTSQAATGVAITKFDSSGNFVWVKETGGTISNQDRGNGMAVDSSGNIYITGGFSGTSDFDPGAGTSNLTSAGSNDIYFSKWDTDGTFVWVKQIGSTSDDWGAKIIINSTNIYLSGAFGGTTDFDPSGSTANLVSTGGADIFVAKYDLSGTYVWAKKMGTSSWGDWVQGMAIDSTGAVYTTGTFGSGTGLVADFDPGAGTANLTTAGNVDIFISKLDTDGNYVYAKAIGDAAWNMTWGIVLDSSNNAYVTGAFADTLDFDPGAGTANLTSTGSDDVFILKLDSSGDFVWAKGFGGTGSDYTEELTIDTSGNIYIVGIFVGTVDFDPGAGTTNLTSAGLGDAFVSKFDSSGNFVWAKGFGGELNDIAHAVYVNSTNGYVYTTGGFANTADFNPDAGVANLTATSVGDIITNVISSGLGDIFISRLIPDIVAPTFVTSNSSNLANTTATITWTTNEASSSIVEYGLTSSYGSTTTEADTGTGVTSHSVNLTGLDGCTTYHYRVKSNDPSANLGTSSDSTFNTSGCASIPIFILQAMSDAMRAQQSNQTNTTNTSTQNNTQANTNSNLTPTKFIFTRNLKLGMRDTQVIELQKFLNSHNFLISTTGPGSLNNETNYFGKATQSSLIKFQKANDIKPAVGYFGPTTRGVVNNK
jgi:hypothetical protein